MIPLLLLILQGGTFGGTADQAFINATMEVDYIRVFQ
jgi:hypothetical protein